MSAPHFVSDTVVHFNIRPNARERMWETVRAAKHVCQVETPPVAPVSSVARTSQARTITLTRLKKRITQLLPLFNFQHTKVSADADLLYLWGAFAKPKPHIPFVIEIDNPYVLTYYNQRSFRWFTKRIRKMLKGAQAITFLSEAAYRHTLELVGSSIADKCFVFSPFMERNYLNNKRQADGTTRYLFVGLDWRRKGGPELLEAFSALQQTDIALTIISRVPKETIAQYAHDTRISFMAPQPRDVLLKEIYPTHDIFVLPSFHESLGVVLLEALSFAMGIITMDTYGASEMVNEKNGYVIEHPVLTPTNFAGKAIVDCVSIEAQQFSDLYLRNGERYENVITSLREGLEIGYANKVAWQEASQALFEEKYAPEVWYNRAHTIFTVYQE